MPLPPAFAITEWVAVLDTAEEIRDLDEEIEALLRLAPDQVLVGRVDCHRGLAEALGVAAGTWCCGLVAETCPDLDRVLDRVRDSARFRRRPLVTGAFRVVRVAD
jgi:hypothetical protein